jgi:hypothetical protein
LVHADLVKSLAGFAAYFVVIASLAILVGWEYERFRKRVRARRYSFFDRYESEVE